MYKASVVISVTGKHYTVLLSEAASDSLNCELSKETALFTSFFSEVSGNILYQGFYKCSSEEIWDKLEEILLEYFSKEDFVMSYIHEQSE